MTSIKSRAERLNEIQAQWMSLEHTAPKAEQNRVFALMREYPGTYFSVNEDMTKAQAMIQGQPVCAPMPFADCLKQWSGKVQSSVLWQNGKWIDYVI